MVPAKRTKTFIIVPNQTHVAENRDGTQSRFAWLRRSTRHGAACRHDRNAVISGPHAPPGHRYHAWAVTQAHVESLHDASLRQSNGPSICVYNCCVYPKQPQTATISCARSADYARASVC